MIEHARLERQPVAETFEVLPRQPAKRQTHLHGRDRWAGKISSGGCGQKTGARIIWRRDAHDLWIAFAGFPHHSSVTLRAYEYKRAVEFFINPFFGKQRVRTVTSADVAELHGKYAHTPINRTGCWAFSPR